MPSTGIDSLELTRAHFQGSLIGSDSFDAAEADQFIAEGKLEAVSFGRAYIANPDLAARFAANAELNPLDKRTIYSGTGAAGYTDYPTMGA
jgi:N-ethylmaleimide reductase